MTVTDERRQQLREADRRYKLRHPDKIRAYEKSPAELKRRAAAKRRLRSTDPEWVQRERNRAAAARTALPADVIEARRAYLAAWRITNRERVRDLNRLRRVRERNAPGASYCTSQKLMARRELYGNHCFYCGVADAQSMDHRIPVSRGGSEFPANQVPACSSCNSRKGTRKPGEWTASR